MASTSATPTTTSTTSPAAGERIYTCGIRVPNKTHANKAVNPVYVTLTHLGAMDEKQLQACIDDLSRPDTGVARPVTIRFNRDATFGSDEDIAAGKGFPVRKCQIMGLEDHKALVNFHVKWGKKDPFMAKKLDEPNFHVKKASIGDELDTMTEVICTSWFIRQRECDPIWTCQK